jgi:hypothetical protein
LFTTSYHSNGGDGIVAFLCCHGNAVNKPLPHYGRSQYVGGSHMYTYLIVTSRGGGGSGQSLSRVKTYLTSLKSPKSPLKGQTLLSTAMAQTRADICRLPHLINYPSSVRIYFSQHCPCPSSGLQPSSLVTCGRQDAPHSQSSVIVYLCLVYCYFWREPFVATQDRPYFTRV